MLTSLEIDSEEETVDTLPTEPAVFALSHLGVVDVDGVEVTETELMAHVLANCTEIQQEEDYMV